MCLFVNIIKQTLVRAPPDESIEFTKPTGISSSASTCLASTVTSSGEQRTLTTARSPSEAGDCWSSADEVRQALAHLRTSAATEVSTHEINGVNCGKNGSTLADIWSGLVVRVMSARSHDFGNALANSFYNQEVGVVFYRNNTVSGFCAPSCSILFEIILDEIFVIFC